MTKINVVKIVVPKNEGITGIPTLITFEFDQDISSLGAVLSVVLLIDEKSVVKTAREMKKVFIPDPANLKKATLNLIFPEALAGATINIKYSIPSDKVGLIKEESNIQIKRLDGREGIEKVYWAEQEQAMWGVKLVERRDIDSDEYGFLHIYTKGMFGKEVYAQIKDEPQVATKPLGANRKTTMRDNVVSIPYAMSDLIAAYKSEVLTFAGDKLTVKAYASETDKFYYPAKSSNLDILCNQLAKNPAKPTTGLEVKVILDSEEEEESEKTNAQCILEFRPNNKYIGDYGFDWVRRGDTGAPGYHHDHDFESHMGKHYVIATKTIETDGNKGDINAIDPTTKAVLNSFQFDNVQNTQILDSKINAVDTSFGEGKMFNHLKFRYRRLIFSWNPDAKATTNYEAYTPIMTITKGKKANLNLLLNVKSDALKITFRFNNDSAKPHLSLDKYEITNNLGITTATRRVHALEITCNSEFEQEYTLMAEAISKGDTKKEVCGMIRILPNHPMCHFKPKIAFISCETLINGIKPVTGKIPTSGEKKMHDILLQAFVFPEIDATPILDLTDPALKFKDDCCVLDGSTYNVDYSKYVELEKLLAERLHEEYKGKYDHYYKIFYFAEDCPGAAGYSYGNKYIVCFDAIKRDDALAVHELLHAFELAHPFDAYSRNTKFTYKFVSTDNIMDYSDLYPPKTIPKSLYHWQWQIVNTKIK